MQDNPEERNLRCGRNIRRDDPNGRRAIRLPARDDLQLRVRDSQVGLNWRHYPSIKDDDAARDPNTRILPVASYNVFNLFGRYQINDRMEFRGGIDNLLDEEPPVVGADPGSAALGLTPDANLGDTNASFYDVLGRRFYVGLQMNF